MVLFSLETSAEMIPVRLGRINPALFQFQGGGSQVFQAAGKDEHIRTPGNELFAQVPNRCRLNPL